MGNAVTDRAGPVARGAGMIGPPAARARPAALVLLKARPTPAQLADRLRPPWPDGLELYLDARDLADGAFAATVARLRAVEPPPGFVWLVEGPVNSLDGGYFDLAAGRPADRLVVRRLVELARAIGARAVNLHAIQPGPDPERLTAAHRAAALARAAEFAREFVELAGGAGLAPTVENMPPVLQQRGGLAWFTPLGLAAEDLLELAARAPGLRFCLDLSHAALYVNARCGRVAPAERARYAALLHYVEQLPAVGSVRDYAERLGDGLLSCHVANARGLLDEGAPYGSGELDLDALVGALAGRIAYFVTEPLEPDPDRAREMRVAQRRLLGALGRPTAEGRGEP